MEFHQQITEYALNFVINLTVKMSKTMNIITIAVIALIVAQIEAYVSYFTVKFDCYKIYFRMTCSINFSHSSPLHTKIWRTQSVTRKPRATRVTLS